MGAGIPGGQAKWERKMAAAGQKWKSRVSVEKTAAGLRGIGLTPGPEYLAALSAGLNATSAADFQGKVSGKGAKWAENYRAGINR